jgi:hypothetical protein
MVTPSADGGLTEPTHSIIDMFIGNKARRRGRMQARRFPRLINAFSKKFSNLKAQVVLHVAHYEGDTSGGGWNQKPRLDKRRTLRVI